MTLLPALERTGDPAVRARVDRRLRPLHVSVFTSFLVLWLPVEKLFLSEIGFTPALIGLMAAVYAGTVPLVEVPSGLLADRWSRLGVFVLAQVATAGASLLGAMSTGVGLYLLSAVLLGVAIAFSSGTVDAMVYDVLVEETGSGEDFTRRIATVRVLEGLGLAVSALGGAGLAALTSTRFTYVLTLVPIVVAVAAAARFREPRLHREGRAAPGVDGSSGAPESLADQVRAVGTLLRDRHAVVPALVLGTVAGVAVQVVLEFGPVWLIALDAPTAFHGVHWALLSATLAVGGRLAVSVDWRHRAVPAVVGAVAAAGGGAAALGSGLAVVVAGQVAVVVVLVVVGVRASQLLHDAVPSTSRSGVASAASTLTWLAFVPAGLGAGLLADLLGIGTVGWLLSALALAVAVLLQRAGARARGTVAS